MSNRTRHAATPAFSWLFYLVGILAIALALYRKYSGRIHDENNAFQSPGEYELHVILQCQLNASESRTRESLLSIISSISYSEAVNFDIKTISLVVAINQTKKADDSISMSKICRKNRERWNLVWSNATESAAAAQNTTFSTLCVPNLSIFETRNLIWTILNLQNESSAPNATLLFFLDASETLTSPQALLTFVEAYHNTSILFDQLLSYRFVFSNALRDGVEHGFREGDEYNPYDIAIGTSEWTETNVHGSKIQHVEVDFARVFPVSTSMLTGMATIMYLHEFYESTGKQLLNQSIMKGNHAGTNSFGCLDSQQEFWIAIASSGLPGFHIPVPLLELSIEHPESENRGIVNPKTERCFLDIRLLKQLKLAPLLEHVSRLKSMWRPSISVIVPFYNVPEPIWFLHTLMSIGAQSFGDFELIIVNDGSSTEKPSTATLNKFSKMLDFTGGIWNGSLPTLNWSLCNPPKSLLFGPSAPPEPFDELPPDSIESYTSSLTAHIHIPTRIITHSINLGLAESRNTGARAARAHNLLYLDPDDFLFPTTLEKLSLLASKTFRRISHGRNADTTIGFLHMPVVHFPDPITPHQKSHCARHPPPTSPHQPLSSTVLDAEKLVLHVSTPPNPDTTPRLLQTTNPLTSTSVISKHVYVTCGGTCPRTVIRYFEDYDFWLRVTSLGVRGVAVMERGAGFWYRRHAAGMSTRLVEGSFESGVVERYTGFMGRIVKWLVETGVFEAGSVAVVKEGEEGRVVDLEWLKEGRVNNPVLFGDLSLREAENFLRLRDWRRMRRRRGKDELVVEGKMNAEMEELDHVVGDLEHFMPCYRKFDLIDTRFNGYLERFKQLRKLYQRTYLANLNITWLIPSMQNAMNGSVMNPVAPPIPLYRSHLFPYNLNLLSKRTLEVTRPNSPTSIIYMIPWMVVGGADLYDLHVLQWFKSHPAWKLASITLVVARNLETYPHPWQHLFLPLVDEIIHLQLLSNDTRTQDEILDYLAESRGCNVLVNSRTIAGYDAIERWGKLSNTNPKSSYRFPKTLVDILHLHHALPDNSNWEHRSARVSRFLTHRIVVSQDLKNHLVNVLGHGDTILGKPVQDNHGPCFQDLNGDWIGGRCTPLSEAESSKIHVIPPPLDILGIETRLLKDGNQYPDPHLRDLISLDKKPLSSLSEDTELFLRLLQQHGNHTDQTQTIPSMFFIGRFESQKDPSMWVRVASRSQKRYYADTGRSMHAHMIGAGALLSSIHTQITNDRFLATPNRRPLPHQAITHLHGSLTHTETIHALVTQSLGSVVVVTSRLEGVPIVVLESLSVGVPVVSGWCGGVSEVFEVAAGMRISFDEGVGRGGDAGVETVSVRIGEESVLVTRMGCGALVHVQCGDLKRLGEVVDESPVFSNDGTGGLSQAFIEDVMADEVVKIWKRIDRVKVRDRVRMWREGKRIREFYGVDQFQERLEKAMKVF